MNRTLLLAGCLLVVLAPAAHATVSVSLNADYYIGGSTITLHVLVTANAGETDVSVFGPLLYPSDRVTPFSVQQNLLPGFSPAVIGCNTARCIAFQQIAPVPTAVNLTNFEIATLTFSLAPVLDPFPISFSWQTTPTTQDLDFFGLTSAPGICITSMDGPPCPIPEPNTAALLALGLAGLAMARRRRR